MPKVPDKESGLFSIFARLINRSVTLNFINAGNKMMFKRTKQAPIESPCVRNCCLNEEDICLGCYRSLEEILQWSKFSSAQLRCVKERIEYRKKLLLKP